MQSLQQKLIFIHCIELKAVGLNSKTDSKCFQNARFQILPLR